MFTQEEFLEQLGTAYTKNVVDRFRRFAYIPKVALERLAEEALTEDWGNGLYVLEKYIAVHVPWSIEAGLFTQSDHQFYVAAGHLQTRYGTPLYLVFERNNREPERWPYVLRFAGSQVSAPEMPSPPDIPEPPEIPVGAEIVMLHDHILGDHDDRVPFLKDTPPVAQMCAVGGAIQWSLNRGLQLPYLYFGKINYLVPLYLRSRENITLMPDLIAPLHVNPETLMVRTVLEPHMPYANARVAVKRHDQLPAWLLDTWSEHSAAVEESQIEDPEPATADVSVADSAEIVGRERR